MPEITVIFPEVTVEDWLAKYPALDVAWPLECSCGSLDQTAIPFISKNYVGFVSGKCPECGLTGACRISTPRDVRLHNEWARLLIGSEYF